MSEDRLGPMRINRPAGSLGQGVNGDMAASPRGDGDGIDVPGLGRFDPGDTPIHAEHNYNKAVFNRLEKDRRQLDHVRVEMDELAAMGDTVSPEDVIAAAGRVVAHGVPARQAASMLADMPQQAGQGLAAWIAQGDASLRQQEAFVDQVYKTAAHRMGMSAVRVIAAEHLRGEARRQAAQTGALGGRAARGAPAATPAAPQGQNGLIPRPSIIQMARSPSEVPEGAGAEEAV